MARKQQTKQQIQELGIDVLKGLFELPLTDAGKASVVELVEKINELVELAN